MRVFVIHYNTVVTLFQLERKMVRRDVLTAATRVYWDRTDFSNSPLGQQGRPLKEYTKKRWQPLVIFQRAKATSRSS